MFIRICKREITRVWKALGYSLSGLKAAIRGEASFQLEVIAIVVLLPFALWLPVEIIKKVFIIESMILVLVMELINVAIESVVNYISEERHVLAKKIKDVASAGVFLCLMNSVGMWIWALSEFF